MALPKLRVLIDLSMAARGHGGIAQDVRLLYKMLASCPEVELTGLVYPPRKFAPPHRFCPVGASRGERLANQSRYLWSLAEGSFVWPDVAPLRGLDRLRQVGATLFGRRVRLDRLDVEHLWPAAWRLLFERTLSPADLPLVRGGTFLLSDLSDGKIYARCLTNRRPLALDTRGFDFFIVQGPRPFRTSPGTRLIARYHDMIPVSQPDTMSNPWVIKWHHRAVEQTAAGGYFVCNSAPTRQRLTSAYPHVQACSTTIPYMLSEAYWPERNLRQLCSIVAARRSPASGAEPRKPPKKIPRYLISVSTLEPRKNFTGLIEAFAQAKSREPVRAAVPNLKLVIVGSPGWKYEPILAAMRELVRRGELIHLEGVTPQELRVLYSHAEALVFPSHAEGFGFPPLEAMRCETPVIASDLPEHRWVLGDAALYCDSYDATSIADAIERLVASEQAATLRGELVARGARQTELYALERCSQQWLDLLRQLKDFGASAPPMPVGPSQHGLMERAA